MLIHLLSFHDPYMFRQEDFEYTRVLGCGTFGRVYLCRLKMKCPIKYFAVKILKKYDIITKKQVEHVDYERKIMRMLYHKHIVKLYGTFEYNKSICLVMEYVCGGELYTYLRKYGRFNLIQTRFYCGEILLAPKHLHENNIIYRDLKPENILLDREGHIKLTDFGFSKIINISAFTQCGTPEYLAPEVILGQPYDHTIDYWALGVITFEMITGTPPFYDKEYHMMYEKIINENIIYPEIDVNLIDIIDKLLIKDPRFRLGRGSIHDIFNHIFFNEFWENLESGKIKPPIKPNIKFEGDSSCYPYYDDDNDESIQYPRNMYMYRFTD